MIGLLMRVFGKRRSSTEDTEEYRLTLGEHLEELRTRIIRVLVLITVGWIVGWYLQPPLYEYLNEMVKTAIKGAIGANIDYKEPFKNATEPFMLKFKLSFLIGLIMVFPFCILQLWGFIKPGLKLKERKPIEKIAPWSLLLFIIGAGFCWIILPSALNWFAGYVLEFAGTSLYQEPGSMVYFVLKMMLAFGIGFQLPVIVFALGSMGLLSAETLTQYWRQWATAVFIGAAVLTPSNDAFSMLMMAVPLVILFAISVWLVKIVQKKKPGELGMEEEGDEAAAS